MTPATPGIHHITAIAGDPQRNLDFYAGLLGLRFVKKTVNFDDPATYHFYFGDELGRPGTVLTFFPWSHAAPRGRTGAGQAVEVAFAVPAGSLGWWGEHLKRHGIQVERPAERFDEEALGFRDPDGLVLLLVAQEPAGATGGPERGSVPAQDAIRGFHGVALREGNLERTAEFLATSLGLQRARDAGDRLRCEVEGPRARGTRATGSGSPEVGTRVDLVAAPAGERRGMMGAGAVHHVAFRARDDAEQGLFRERLLERGLDVTPVRDRCYFHSIYFHEPGGVLFEIATDSPGFTVDERPEELGKGLRLPPWLEPYRGRIENALPPVHAPEAPPG